MRMAKLKVDGRKGFYISPEGVVLSEWDDGRVTVETHSGCLYGNLAQPLSEALDELNAAMRENEGKLHNRKVQRAVHE
jgi:hypothetical protein